MEPLTILAVTKTAAAIYLAVCIIVAAVIGYATSYLYYKPIYMKKIHNLEADLEERKNEIKMLNERVTRLELEINKKEEECRQLQNKIKESKIS
jgi:uncharacterized membrane protein (DUF106 family)